MTRQEAYKILAQESYKGALRTIKRAQEEENTERRMALTVSILLADLEGRIGAMGWEKWAETSLDLSQDWNKMTMALLEKEDKGVIEKALAEGKHL